jgi:hypothetical protein
MKKTLKRILQTLILYVSYNITIKKEKKIVIGIKETANVLFNMKSLFGSNCITVCKYRNRYYVNNKYDIEINNRKITQIVLSPFILGKLAKNARCFIYLSDTELLFDTEMDFKFLKRHKIPIIFCFLGSDIRAPRLFLEYCKKIHFNTYIEYDNPKLFFSDNYDNTIRMVAGRADKYASIIFSHKHDQISYLKNEQYFFPPPIDEGLFSFNHEKFGNRPLRILHAPSNPVVKGTPLVRCVIRQLKEEGYDFQYIELIGVPNETVIMELKQSHIVLNQFYLLLPGIFGLEAMATGNAVLMSAKHEEMPYQFNNAWLETEDRQLYRHLKYLLDHPDKIIEYAQNGYEYTKRNFSKTAILNYLEDIFSKNEIPLNNKHGKSE